LGSGAIWAMPCRDIPRQVMTIIISFLTEY
jgi:hypothetical protein